MFRHVVLVTALAVVLLGSSARADEIPRTISVRGHGEVAATPDIAHAAVGVRTVAETARAALSDNSATMTAILQALRNAGIADRDVQTIGLSLNPRWAPKVQDDGTRTQALIGYEASNQLRVTCRDLSRLGELLDVLVEAGANDMHGIAFDIDDKARLIEEARALAVRDGRARAGLLAREAGVKLGRVLSVSEEGGGVPVFQGRAMAEMAVAAVPIAEGEQTISAGVALTYEIE